MTARIQDNIIKGVFFIVLFTLLLLQSLTSQAQGSYKGFTVSFGSRTSALASSIEALDGSQLHQAGGEVGLVFGNEIMRAKVGLLGYYSSGANTAGTTDLYTHNATVNLYPLTWILQRQLLIEPYFTGGLDYDKYRFYGYYLRQEPGTTNYSQAEAPYLGKVKSISANAGLGVEVRIRDDHDFIHLFSEFRMGKAVSSSAKEVAFTRTSAERPAQLLVGVRFGAHR